MFAKVKGGGLQDFCGRTLLGSVQVEAGWPRAKLLKHIIPTIVAEFKHCKTTQMHSQTTYDETIDFLLFSGRGVGCKYARISWEVSIRRIRLGGRGGVGLG